MLNCQLDAGAVLRRTALVLKQERAVDQLDVNAAVLHRLNGAGDLDELPRGFLGIGVGGFRRTSSLIPLSSGERLSGLQGLLHRHLFASEPAARNVFKIKIPGRLPVRISDFEAAGVAARLRV